MTKVVNLRDETYDVYIGRPSMYGNPYSIGTLSRKEVVQKYKEYFYKRLEVDEEFRRAVLSLQGKVLGCYCKQKWNPDIPCHGDIIKEYLDNLKLE